MNNKILQDIVQNKDLLLGTLRDDIDYPKLVQAARDSWKDYEPIPDSSTKTVAIDGGMNFKPFQGMTLYVVDSVAVTPTNHMVNGIGKHGSGMDWDYDINTYNKEHVQSKMMISEMKSLTQALTVDYVDKGLAIPDHILVDGSFASWSESGVFKGAYPEAQEAKAIFLTTIRQRHLLTVPKMPVFISKSSDSPFYFKNIKTENKMGDIFYFNEMNHREAGYSAVKENSNYLKKSRIGIITFFARLKKDLPIYKYELLNTSGTLLTKEQLKELEEKFIRKLLDRLVYLSVKGYPYCLNLAHQNAKISDPDLRKVIRVLRMEREPGSREAVE